MRRVLIFIIISALSLNLNLGFGFCDDKGDKNLKREVEIGKKALPEIKKHFEIISDPVITARLDMILNRLEPHMSRRIDWNIYLIKSDVINAFCLPGGFIFFTTGILNILHHDSEIAAVMAHEMIHADRSHSLRMMAKSNKVTLGALAVMLASGGAAAPIILAQVAQVAITSGYTIEFEKEADSLGLEALIESGYNPAGMVVLFEKFLYDDFTKPIINAGIYMNHPETNKRLETTLKTLREKNIPVNRKYSLNILRTAIDEKNNNLLIDGNIILNAKNVNSLKNIKSNLDNFLQMETAPYEINIIGENLKIKNKLILNSNDVNTPLKNIRENLVKAVDSAKIKYPTSRTFK